MKGHHVRNKGDFSTSTKRSSSDFERFNGGAYVIAFSIDFIALLISASINHHNSSISLHNIKIYQPLPTSINKKRYTDLKTARNTPLLVHNEIETPDSISSLVAILSKQQSRYMALQGPYIAPCRADKTIRAFIPRPNESIHSPGQHHDRQTNTSTSSCT